MDELKAQIRGVFKQGEYRYRVSGEELTIFTRQLATMLGSGIPLHQALTYFGETSEGDLPDIITQVAMDVSSGHTFSNAMQASNKKIWNIRKLEYYVFFALNSK